MGIQVYKVTTLIKLEIVSTELVAHKDHDKQSENKTSCKIKQTKATTYIEEFQANNFPIIFG